MNALRRYSEPDADPPPRSFDGGGRLLARFTVSHPAAAYRLASSLGAFRHRLTRRWPTLAEVQALFPHLEPRAAAEVATRVAALHERNLLLVRTIFAHGIDPVSPMVSVAENLAAMQGPKILGTFHVGALHAIGAALERLRSPVLVLRSGILFTPRAPLQVQSTEGGDQQRAAALHRALRHLRDGGLVVMALDVVADRGFEAACLGHPLRIAPGAFALARWTKAPIVPVVSRWVSSGIHVDADEPVSSPDEAAQWLERFLMASPSEITLGLLRILLGLG
ncbi:MAG: hypothetical protein ACXV7D_08860 [Thermoanaerobaculia bacterium]